MAVVNRILKVGVLEELKIYQLYLERIMKEYDLIWNRFKIYFGFCSGVLLVMGFLFQHYLGKPSQASLELGIILIILGVLGGVFSVLWLLVNLDGRRWQVVMNEVIRDVEKALFINTNIALYNKIEEKRKKNPWWKPDVVSINLFVPMIFIVVFIAIVLLALCPAIFAVGQPTQP